MTGEQAVHYILSILEKNLITLNAISKIVYEQEERIRNLEKELERRKK